MLGDRESLQAVLSNVLEDAGHELGTLARLTLQRAQAQWRELDEHLAWCDERIDAHGRDNPAVRQAATLIGVGPVTASAAVATVGDFKQFKNGAQFGAWIGLTPRQRSSGGKNNLGGITKRGDTYLQTLTGGDKGKPIVFYCRSSSCWHSYNASLRAVEAGYTNVLWYRGGIDAWQQSGGVTVPYALSDAAK